MDVAVWLQNLGLERYKETFAENDIDAEILTELNEQDLHAIGIASLGHRKKILKAIAAFSPIDEVLSETAVPPSADDKSTTTIQTNSSARSDADRRQLTVLFCDLVGSTALSTQFDPEDLRDILRAYQDICAGVITRFEGFVASFKAMA